MSGALRLHRELASKDIEDPQSRQDIVKLCKALASELQDPAVQAFDWLGSFCVNPALCIAADLNLFTLLDDGPKNVNELAAATTADPLLISKIGPEQCSIR